MEMEFWTNLNNMEIVPKSIGIKKKTVLENDIERFNLENRLVPREL